MWFLGLMWVRGGERALAATASGSLLEECGAAAGGKFSTTGSAAASPVLVQFRAGVLKREVHRCQYPSAAFGAAILAARSPFYGGDLSAAIQGMTRVLESFRPDPATVGPYEAIYASFRAACAQRGYA